MLPIVITSIFNPTKAVRAFSKKKDSRLIVVADAKTPKNWKQENVEFISVEDQNKSKLNLAKLLPFNNYARKNLGYLYAMESGEEIIAETDDDNIPYKNWGLIGAKNYKVLKSNDTFINIYKYFSKEHVWPRGLPLDYITKKQKVNNITNKKIKVGIYQYMADLDPDVDAIYRLTINKQVKFNKSAKPVVLSKGLFSPFNSQNTFFVRQTFPLMYLPSWVSIRATDIYRGIIAQRIIWENNYSLYFGTASVYQERNFHNYMKDFELEVPVYLNIKKMAEILLDLSFNSHDPIINLIRTYERLSIEGIIPKKEITLVKAWAKDCERLLSKHH